MKKIVSIALGLFMVLASVGCKSSISSYGLKAKNTLRINLDTEPPTLDWSKSVDRSSSMIIENIMDGLTSFNLDDPELSLRPALAKKWSSSANTRKWTFTLRNDVKWIDGVPFEAQHIVDSWERLLNPNTASEYAYFLYTVKNARKYNSGKIKDFSKVGVKAVGKHKLVVELEAPQSYFPLLLTHTSTFPIRKDVVAKHGDSWTDPENIVTLGAYKVKIWDHDKAMVLKRNEEYYGGLPHIENILAYMVAESSTAISLFDAKQLDMQGSLPSIELPILKRRKEYRGVGILSIFYYGFNIKKPPMDNINVRKALVHAINRKQITDVMGGGQVPITSWVPPGMFGYEPKVGLKFNPKKARAYLKKAGYGPGGKKFPRLSLTFNTSENQKRIAEMVQSQWKKNLGINVELQNEEWKVYLKNLRVNRHHIYRLGWLADYPDPDNFLNLMTSYSDNNHTGWGDKKFDQLIEKAVSQTNKRTRRSYYSQAQKIMTERDAAVLPVMSGINHYLISDRVINFPVNTMGRTPFKGIKLKEIQSEEDTKLKE